MQTNLENLSALERKLNVEVATDEIESKVKSKLQKFVATAKLPGFRPGKVPLNVIEKKYGGAVRSEVLENLIRDTYTEALTQEKLNPAGMPKIEIISSEPGKDFVYSATFEVYPEIKLVDFKELEVEKPVSEITDDDLTEMLEKMRKSHADWREIAAEDRKSQEGDQVTIDLTVVPVEADENIKPREEKDVKFILGDGSMWKEFDQALRGVGVAEEKEFILELPATHSDKELADKKANFNVKVHKVSEPILPELDDEFAKKMKIEGGVEGLKAEVRKHLVKELKVALQGMLKKAIMDEMLKHHSVEVPKSMVENELSRLEKQWDGRFTQSGKTPEQTPKFPRNEFEDQAKKSVTLGLLLSAIVKEHQIIVEKNEVRKKIEDLVTDYYDDANSEMIEQYLSNQNYMTEMEALLLEEKVLDYLSSAMKISEKSISYKDVMGKK